MFTQLLAANVYVYVYEREIVSTLIAEVRYKSNAPAADIVRLMSALNFVQSGQNHFTCYVFPYGAKVWG